MKSCTTLSSDLLLEISVILRLPTLFLSLLMKLFSSLLFLIMVHYLSWMNSLLMIISTVREAWLEEPHKLDRIIYVSNSSELTQRNIKSITKLYSLELSAYLVGTWLIGVNKSRLKESVIFLRVSAYTKW